MRPFHPLPEILILGAMRAGTTFLHHALSAHPQIAPPRRKELQFFSLRWSEGVAAYRRDLPRRWPAWAYGAAGRPLALDATPYYLFHPNAPARVRQALGVNFKAIVLLREPADRAWSHYRLSLLRGHEHLGFLDAIDAEPARLAAEAERLARGDERLDAPHQTQSYVARGRYAEQLSRWWAVFPRERFLVLNSASLFDAPQATFDRVCRFLEIAPRPCEIGAPRNALDELPLPAAARQKLDELLAEPNARLEEMTGIAFRPQDGPGEKPSLHILHVGKTGGTAVKAALKHHVRAGRFGIVLHTHDVTLADIPAGSKAVLFLRHPVSRFVSAFYSRQRQGQPRHDHPWSPGEARAFATFKTANALAGALASQSALGAKARTAMGDIRHVRDSVCRWIVSDDYFRARRGDVVFVGFQEQLDEDFVRLCALLGLPAGIELPADDTAAHRNPADMDRRLDPVAIANLQSWYARDIAFYERVRRESAAVSASDKAAPNPESCPESPWDGGSGRRTTESAGARTSPTATRSCS